MTMLYLIVICSSSVYCYLMDYFNFLSTAAKTGDPAKIDSVTITPDPPQKGKSVTVKATITLCMLESSNT